MAALALLLAGSAQPVTTAGKIAFASNASNGVDWDVWVMNSDGTGATDLTNRIGFDSVPAWSPDGSKIAFSRDGGIAVMRADGSDVHVVVPTGSFAAWSPDGTKLAYASGGIHVVGADGTGDVQLTNQGLDYRPSWSPDGSHIVFDRWVSFANQTRAIFVMRSDGTDLRQLTPDTSDATAPRYSPDGTRIAFRHAAECCSYPGFSSPTGSSGGIALINADGSGLAQLTPLGSFDDAPAWSPDGGSIAFDRSSAFGGADLYEMNADGSNVTRLTNMPGREELPAWQPVVSADTTPPVLALPPPMTVEATQPGGTVGSFTATATDSVDGAVPVACDPASGSTFPLGTTTVRCSAHDAAGNVASGAFSITVHDTTAPSTAADLVFVNDGVAGGGARYRVNASCWDAVGVVSQTTKLNGVDVSDGQVVALLKAGSTQPTKILPDGTLRIAGPAFELVVVCRDGAANTGSATAAPGPRGKILFISDRSGSRELYSINADGSDVTRLTFNDLFERAPRWSPDRTQIAFSARDTTGNWDIYAMKADGSGLRRLTTDPGRDDYPAWTPDGTRLIYDHEFSVIHMVNADGTNDHVIPVGPGNSFSADVSPDGTSLAFANDRSGTDAIYVAALAGGTARQITAGSVGGDFQPRWSPDGRRLLFLRDVGAGDSDLYTVDADGTGLTQLTATPTRIEFAASWAPTGSSVVFWTGDGRLHTITADGNADTPLATGLASPFVVTFDRPGVVDNSMFHTISDSGGSIIASGGRLEASVQNDADPSAHNYDQIDEHIGTQCQLPGDFDVQVDYALLTWPQHGGFFAMLNAIFGDGAVARTSQPWTPPYDEQYTAWTNGDTFSGNSLNTTDTSGQMRLVRHNGLLYAYVRSSASAPWTFVHVGAATGAAVAAIGLWAPGNIFTHVDGKVAYDNLHFSSGSFMCPGWWTDAWPDWR